MKQHKRIILTTIIFSVLPMVAGILLWNRMPDKVAVHWGIENQANGWASKTLAVFGIPLMLGVMQCILVFATLNDPKKNNISKKMMTLIMWIMPVISWTCCLSIYGAAVGISVNIGLIANLLIGILFIGIGNYMPKSKQSYTVGIRIPWTLSSEENWNRTSRLAGKLWVVAGLVMLANVYFQNYLILFVVLVAIVLVPFGYSFFLFQKFQKND